MITDGVSRECLLELVKQALLDANTMAGARVDVARDWPSTVYEFPLILIQSPRERKISIFPGMLEFNSTISIVVVGRTVGITPGAARSDVERLTDQIINGAFLSIPLLRAVQQFATVDTQIVLSSEGKQHIGEVSVSFELVVYQAYGSPGEPLTNITGTVDVAGGIPGDAPPFSIEMLSSRVIQST